MPEQHRQASSPVLSFPSSAVRRKAPEDACTRTDPAPVIAFSNENSAPKKAYKGDFRIGSLSGEQFNSKLGMLNLRARDYDQTLGMFASLDPFGGRQQDPQSLHKYAFCHGDPVNGLDPSGQMTLIGVLSVANTASSGVLPLPYGGPDEWRSPPRRLRIFVGFGPDTRRRIGNYDFYVPQMQIFATRVEMRYFNRVEITVQSNVSTRRIRGASQRNDYVFVWSHGWAPGAPITPRMPASLGLAPGPVWVRVPDIFNLNIPVRAETVFIACCYCKWLETQVTTPVSVVKLFPEQRRTLESRAAQLMIEGRMLQVIQEWLAR